jgi:hypothetical protein
MPGHADQMVRIGPANFKQRLRRRDDLDQAAVFQHQRVAAAQRHRVFQVEQEFQPAGTRHRHSPPVPIVEIEHDGIGRHLAPVVLALDSGGADHAGTVPPRVPVIVPRPFPA